MGILTPDEVGILVPVEVSIGLVGATCAIGCLTYEHALKKEPLHFHEHMVFILFVLDLLDAVPMVFGRRFVHNPDDLPCQLQAAGIVTFEQCIITWNTFMSVQLYSWIILKTHARKLRQRVYPVLVSIVAFSFLNTSLWRFYYTKFGPTEMWCWFPNNFARLGATYIYVLSSVMVITTIIVRLCVKIVHTRNQQRGIAYVHSAARSRVSQQLIIYLMCYLATWFWSTVNRYLQLLTGRSYPVITLLHVLSKPSMLFWDSLAYGSAWTRLHSLWAGRKVPLKTGDPSMVTLVRRSLTDAQAICDEKMEKLASIFASTYNCKGLNPEELDLSETLEHWLPPGHDIYIIALQEAKGLSTFKSFIRQHLGGSRQWSVFSHQMGVMGGSHLMGCIAVLVFVRERDVESQRFQALEFMEAGANEVVQGFNLGVCRAGNKGAVCLSFRFHDTTFAVIAAHLPSDGPRGNMARDRDAALKELFHMGKTGRACFDIHLQHQHTIFLGDLNYRLRGSPEQVLSDIVTAAQESVVTLEARQNRSQSSSKKSPLSNSSTQGTPRNRAPAVDIEKKGTWLDRRYRSLRPGRQSIEPAAAWEDVLLVKDELRAAHRAGVLLHGFEERPISFPPSYRRVTGPEGDCFDYCDFKRVKAGYTTWLGGEKSEGGDVEEGHANSGSEDGGKVHGRMRVPSYTDRIMVHSLPDVKGELRMHAYEMCDVLWTSDHRPVSAVLHLDLPEIERNAQHGRSIARSPDRVAKGASRASSSSMSWPGTSLTHGYNHLGPPTLAFYIRISNLQVQLLRQPPTRLMSAASSVQSDGSCCSNESPRVEPDSPVSPAVRPSLFAKGLSPSRIQLRPSLLSQSSSSSSCTPLTGSEPPTPPPRLLPRRWMSEEGPLPQPLTPQRTAPVAPTISEVVVLFPLPFENRIDSRTRAVKQLDANLSGCSHNRDSEFSASAAGLLNELTVFKWDDVCRSGGVMDLSAVAEKFDGRLHALIKLVDDRGVDVAQGVVVVPLERKVGPQAVSGALSLHTTHCGSYTCSVELVKVKMKRNVKRQQNHESQPAGTAPIMVAVV